MGPHSLNVYPQADPAGGCSVTGGGKGGGSATNVRAYNVDSASSLIPNLVCTANGGNNPDSCGHEEILVYEHKNGWSSSGNCYGVILLMPVEGTNADVLLWSSADLMVESSLDEFLVLNETVTGSLSFTVQWHHAVSSGPTVEHVKFDGNLPLGENGLMFWIYWEGGFDNIEFCEPLDECFTNAHDCHASASCSDTAASFTCACNTGYSDGGGTTGTSCLTDLMVESSLDEFLVLNETVTGSLSFTVQWHHAVSSGPTVEHVKFDGNLPLGENGLMFWIYWEGGFDNIEFCEPLDECFTNAHDCHASASCSDTAASFTCACNTGYSDGGGTTGTSCLNIDECSTNAHDCNANATCADSAGSFGCACNAGFVGDGITCADGDECALSRENCHTDASCSNIVGSFLCGCNTGFEGDGVTCSNAAECISGAHNCDFPRASCADTVGSFLCTCLTGFSGDGITCADLDECTVPSHNCHSDASCTNSAGSFTCACNSGFTGDGLSCSVAVGTTVSVLPPSDIAAGGSWTEDASTPYNGHNSFYSDYAGSDVSCQGKYRAKSSSGWETQYKPSMAFDRVLDASSYFKSGHATNPRTGSVDTSRVYDFILELPCAVEIAGWGAGPANNGATGTDEMIREVKVYGSTDGTTWVEIGSYADQAWSSAVIKEYTVSSCTAGAFDQFKFEVYRRYHHSIGAFSVSEVEIYPNECTIPSHNCHSDASCTNSAGSFSCACNAGFTGDGLSCSDVAECMLGSDNCHTDATCNDSWGSFVCNCNAGTSGDGVVCSDVNECSLASHDCNGNATCANTAGSFECSCNTGFTGSGIACAVANECSLGTHNCHSDASCADNGLSFLCTCNTGFSGDGVTCTAASCNETSDPQPNNLTSNVFRISAGQTGNTGDSASFAYMCDPGFVLDSAGNVNFNCTGDAPGTSTWKGTPPTCSVANECNLNIHNCDANATCTDAGASFTCACNVGFSGDGVGCTDLNECTLDTDNCASLASCANTHGSFSCSCNPGATGDGVNCTDRDECALTTHSCESPGGTCANSQGSFSCTCLSGFGGDTCADIDECSTGANDCHGSATCFNLDGSFTCSCNSGFAGDGVQCYVLDECSTGMHLCARRTSDFSPSAVTFTADCTDTAGSYSCSCRWGYTDRTGVGSICEDVVCANQPQTPANGALTFSNPMRTSVTESIVTASCDPGFTLDSGGGGDTITCEGTSQTTAAWPSHSFRCNDGFIQVGELSLTCEGVEGAVPAVAAWPSHTADCQAPEIPHLGTMSPSSPPNGVAWTTGDAVTFGCVGDTVLQGDASKTCVGNSDGTAVWVPYSAGPPTCTGKGGMWVRVDGWKVRTG
uniref:Uncharacterized protein n=1 Tax=Chromera velia CCMP2878 TaxID=1169474 RepID=A0A0G4GPU7_9ALVE|eukprot:Cvel_5026.t1-p1 / transcript=Cvel_5026.t1 / gene=Cvel_5026 / organism=Chromera_velia_CCMP2878 / gene_product=Fibrillin-1, putative / transcript_product=Fibrillin-1, putative / location=Cvel_scaffold228:85908-104811(-) / protein_length=1341 / sequence_SO=supercontig / SO=protein_coding / is_pseudo=false